MAGWWPSFSARAPTWFVKPSASAKFRKWKTPSSRAIPSRSSSCQAETSRLSSAISASVTQGESRRGRRRSSRRRLPPLGPSALAELDLLDLAGAGHRKRVDECDVARDLEARYAAAAVFDHLALSQLAARRELHEGHCHL